MSTNTPQADRPYGSRHLAARIATRITIIALTILILSYPHLGLRAAITRTETYYIGLAFGALVTYLLTTSGGDTQ